MCCSETSTCCDFSCYSSGDSNCLLLFRRCRCYLFVAVSVSVTVSVQPLLLSLLLIEHCVGSITNPFSASLWRLAIRQGGVQQVGGLGVDMPDIALLDL